MVAPCVEDVSGLDVLPGSVTIENAMNRTVSALRSHPLGTVLLVVLLFMAACGVWSFIEPRMLRVSEATVVSPDLPPQFDGLRVAYIADVHAGPFFSRRRVAKVVGRVNGLEPDLVLIGGDNVGGRRGGDRKFYPEAARLEAPLGVFGVLGNHDYWEGEAQARSRMASAGIEVIDNASVAVTKGGERILLGGVEDYWEGEPDIVQAAEGIEPSEFAMLLTHNPDELAKGLPQTAGLWDLALGGHMHAGQITFFGRWAPIVPSQYGQRYRTGWLEENGTLILVTNGVGVVTFPVRFFAPPEVNLITLKRGPNLAVEGAELRGR